MNRSRSLLPALRSIVRLGSRLRTSPDASRKVASGAFYSCGALSQTGIVACLKTSRPCIAAPAGSFVYGEGVETARGPRESLTVGHV